MGSEKNEIPVTTRRHSAAHVLAQAIMEKYPEASLAIGPDIENGFYYDVAVNEPITAEDILDLEKSMKRIAKARQKFERYSLPAREAIEYLKTTGQGFKLEMAQDLIQSGETEISFYKNFQPQDGKITFVDMCRGPHVTNTGEIGSFKLTNVSGAYWRGDSNNQQLQRVYGILFETDEELKAHMRMLEEAKKRDHRRLGEDLDLFSLQEDAGGGLVFWHPRGARIRREIEKYWYEKHEAGGYEFLYTPHIANLDLWNTSGHTDFYADGMFEPMKDENVSFQLKPMNCPFHVLIFKDTLRSYRDLPLRWAEMGTVYRREMSGALHGLMRVRGFTQDDAHLFIREDQIEEEIIRVMEFIMDVLGAFGFSEYEINLSTRPEKSVGEDRIWEVATKALETSLKKMNLEFQIDEGGGAFYGPKIDVKIKDAIGRLWQCSTVQLDFNLPERFDLTYVDENNTRVRPIMIHRALLGSIERFFGVLIENYAGAFPLWLAPEQIRLLLVNEKFKPFAQELKEKLSKAGLRVHLDDSDETLGKKIRNAEKRKINYMLVIGEKEAEGGPLNVRSYFTGEQTEQGVDGFINACQEEVKNRTIVEKVEKKKTDTSR